MKEKLLDLIRIITYYPRKTLDFSLYHLYFKRHNNWEKLKEYFDKDLLIVGNGPSLNNTPLDKLSSKFVSIGMNKINLIYEKTSWRPNLIVCVNGLVLNQNKDYFNKTEKLLILPIKAFYLGIKPRKNVFFIKLKDQKRLEENIEDGLSTGCTVTFTALQVAAYLKPKSVNIVGVDHSFTIAKGTDHDIKKFEGDDVNHFSKEYFKNQYWGVPNLKGSELLYQISKDYFDKKQIAITDYTVNGKLAIFNKGDIGHLLKSSQTSYTLS